MILVGYQGIKGSNSEKAAIELCKKHKFQDARLVPLVSSFNVIENIVSQTIDYGVVAMRNNTGGTVKESVQSLQFMKVKFVDEITLKITHHLFVKDASITKDQIKAIASHTQAFIQCQKSLLEKYPNIELIPDEDTATAAMKLRIDLFEPTTAVLCRKSAGKHHQLFLLEEHLEDRKDNKTTFEMYRL